MFLLVGRMKLKLFVWTWSNESKSLILVLSTKRLPPHWPHLEAKCRCVVNRIATFMSEHHWTCTIFRSSCYQVVCQMFVSLLAQCSEHKPFKWIWRFIIHYYSFFPRNVIILGTLIKILVDRHRLPNRQIWKLNQMVRLSPAEAIRINLYLIIEICLMSCEWPSKKRKIQN